VEINHAAAETALVDQLEIHADTVGSDCLPPPTTTGVDEHVVFVDQPGLDCTPGQLGTSHADVASNTRFHLPDRFGIEPALDPRPGARDHVQR
jgi:hypothetical protein